MIECNDIPKIAAELQAKFEKCKTLKAADMDLLVDLVLAAKNCSENNLAQNNIFTSINTGAQVTQESDIPDIINNLPQFIIEDTEIGIIYIQVNNVDSKYLLKSGKGIYGLNSNNDIVLSDIELIYNKENPTGLEALNEGNGIGWRLIGRNSNNYGTIGQEAIDFGSSLNSSNLIGATGNRSINFSEEGIASGYGSFLGTGFSNEATGTYTTIFGYDNHANGYSTGIFGSFNRETSSTGYNFIQGQGNNISTNSGFASGVALLKGAGVGTSVLGTANVDITSQNNGTDVNAPMIIIGNGTHTTPNGAAWVAITRSNLLVGLRNGEVTLPSTTIAVIDNEVTGKQIVTKEWINAQNFNSNLSDIDFSNSFELPFVNNTSDNFNYNSKLKWQEGLGDALVIDDLSNFSFPNKSLLSQSSLRFRNETTGNTKQGVILLAQGDDITYPTQMGWNINNGIFNNWYFDGTIGRILQLNDDGLLLAPTLTNTLIDNSATGKELITLDYFNANNSGGVVSLEGYSETGNQGNGDLEVTLGDNTHPTLQSYITLDSPDEQVELGTLNSFIRLRQNAAIFELDNITYRDRVSTNSVAFSLSNLTGIRNLQYPDASGTLARLEDLEDSLSLSSTNVTNTNALLTHVGGMNDIDSTTNVTITIQDNATENIPVGSILTYNQINTGRAIVTYSGTASGDSGQTYKVGDVLTLWHKSLDNWVILNPPKALDSTTVGEPTGSDQVFNVVSLTQAEYDAGTPVATTLYNIIP